MSTAANSDVQLVEWSLTATATPSGRSSNGINRWSADYLQRNGQPDLSEDLARKPLSRRGSSFPNCASLRNSGLVMRNHPFPSWQTTPPTGPRAIHEAEPVEAIHELPLIRSVAGGASRQP